MIAFPVERTYLQAEPLRPPKSHGVESANKSSALHSREEEGGEQPLLFNQPEKEIYIGKVDEPVPSEGKGTLIDLVL